VSNIKLFTILTVLLSLGLGTACTPPPPVGPTPAEIAAEEAKKAADDAAEAARLEQERLEAARRAEEARLRAEQERLEAERRAAEEAARQKLLTAAEAALLDINFDYNRSDIRRADRIKFQVIAEFMNAFPEAGVNIEGHCDERGTIEYNMALGERRAVAARSYLVSLGINEGRFNTISYGKERPKEFGNNERSWLANRRCEFKLQ
jgi:peptidoglycan-associated lipoprotein